MFGISNVSSVVGKNELKINNLTVTLRDYPTPYHTSWQKIAKQTEIVHMRQSQICYTVMFLNTISMLYSSRKYVISGSLPVYENSKILFPVFVHITKRRRIKF